MAEEVRPALESAAKLTARRGLMRFTRFLDPAQARLADEIARECGVATDRWGGYEEAERKIVCFHPPDETPAKRDYPLSCLHSRYSAKFCSLSHRDILGAFMALGLTRSCIGDILIEDEDIYLFCLSQSAGLIVESLTSAGKASLRFETLDEIPAMPAPKGSSFSAVVSSMRLDAILAAAYRLSRNAAAEAVRSGLVKLDHLPCEHIDAAVSEGALLSMHGHGRIRLMSVDGKTRKQRIGVTFFRYE